MEQRRQRARLRRLFAERFSKEELRTLCYDTGVPYEDFPDSVSGLAREMLVYCENRECVSDLIEVARELRPDIDWDAFPSPSEPGGDLASGVWRCPAGTRNARFVGSITSRKYHSPECVWADRIDPDNRLCFASYGAARAFGYLPCRICKPPS